MFAWLLCLCMVFPMLVSCAKTEEVTELTDEDLQSEEYAEIVDGIDPETDTDLEALRASAEDESLVGTSVQYSNSKLVEIRRDSPNKSSRDGTKIDTITIHCMAGQLSVELCGEVFRKKEAKASSNYGIGSDGRVALYVEEQYRSWCSSNDSNDKRAVTIEVASDSFSPYKVNDKAYKSLIRLVTDICKRNGIEKLVWSTDKKERIQHTNGANMTVHRDFANKACPGQYLLDRMGEIADQVNKNLGAK